MKGNENLVLNEKFTCERCEDKFSHGRIVNNKCYCENCRE